MQDTKFITVTSTIKNSAKTSTAIGLVISLVTEGYKVLYLGFDNKLNFLPNEEEDQVLAKDYILEKVTLNRAMRHFYSFYPFDMFDINSDLVKWLKDITEKQQAKIISKLFKDIKHERYHYVVIDLNYKDKPIHNAIIKMSDHCFFTINVDRYEDGITQQEINAFLSLVPKKEHIKLLITQFKRFMVDHHKFIENLKYIYGDFVFNHQIDSSRAMRNRIDHAYNYTRVDKLCKPIKKYILESK
ncbi:ParA family protein [Mycoplasma bradburyae]|uniref:ParA family protein n=1 Tax=Mycoplasma bradburyae TaxID=2963128 RepID=A0ABT5GBC9_9MOLU|nr:ParA family protein [Mycoplasma bradburyae]MDC4182188.1 ParA family protein [Mycoplasma bradburyae]UTS70014.1 ParA family protein [Mycoplasma bradburyae]